MSAIELLFVDEHVVVANKPSGLLVHRGWGQDDDVAMFRVRDALGGAHVHPLHRLDRGTSGALVLARTREVHAELSKQFEAHSVQKSYLALVRGKPSGSGTVNHAIPRTEDGERVAAVTHYRVLAQSSVDRCSLVLAMPETGRLHQVRRHLRHLGHPLVGDVKYGSGVINRHYRDTYAFLRLGLHAHTIAFTHPVSGTRVEVTAPLPEDFGSALAKLGLLQNVPVMPALL